MGDAVIGCQLFGIGHEFSRVEIRHKSAEGAPRLLIELAEGDSLFKSFFFQKGVQEPEEFIAGVEPHIQEPPGCLVDFGDLLEIEGEAERDHLGDGVTGGETHGLHGTGAYAHPLLDKAEVAGGFEVLESPHVTDCVHAAAAQIDLLPHPCFCFRE